MIDRTMVEDLVDNAVNNVFFECQNEVGATGDISPLDALELDDIQEKLTALICRVVDAATPEKSSEPEDTEYQVRYYIGDYIVCTSEATTNFEDAVEEAQCFSCSAYDEAYEEDEDAYLDTYVEVIRCSDLTKMFWMSEDERGSDYNGNDEKINNILNEVL